MPSLSTETILKKLGLAEPTQLLTYFPRKYVDFSTWATIQEIKPGDTVTLKVTIKTISSRFSFKSRVNLAEALVSDSTGSLKVTWFHQGYLAKTLKAGDEIYLSGEITFHKTLQLINPVYEKASELHLHTGRLVPIYKLPEGVYAKSFRSAISEQLPLAASLSDIIPPYIRSTENLPTLEWSLQQLHFPDSEAHLHRAQYRMVFNEVFIQQLAVQLHKQKLTELPAPHILINIPLIKKIISKLPFSLTIGQKKAIWEITQDLQNKHPMNRILQGDVGSGKTIVAVISALQAIKAGFQIVLLVPTEVLAYQHYESITTLLNNFTKPYSQTPTALLTRSQCKSTITAETKKDLLNAIKKQKVSLIIGTHALLQEHVEFKKLGLVIIDEQHRFGVAQRKLLTTTKVFNSPSKQKFFPHRLSMSATPIPRTLALTSYGDLDISTLSTKPTGRLPIITRVVTEPERLKAYNFIQSNINKGRQVYIITPLVEESSRLQIKSVKEEYNRLTKTIFKGVPAGLLYGSMKSIEKEKTMQDFNQHKTAILVATSIVEIGVDVPNANIIVIEGAERFGLAQLHQLRGRVGRGMHQSYCFLFPSQTTVNLDRLHTFAECNDGFKLAEIDLAERGFGSLFGNNQTGFTFTFSKSLSLPLLKKLKTITEDFISTNQLSNYPHLEKEVLPLIEDIHLE